jgi:acetyltransferase-like isoleucine patch superfamily enzyme
LTLGERCFGLTWGSRSGRNTAPRLLRVPATHDRPVAAQTPAGDHSVVLDRVDAPNAQLSNRSVRLYLSQLVRYVTNHVVSHIPSATIRHGWYRNVNGVEIGKSSVVLMGAYLYVGVRRRNRKPQISIGDHTVVNRDCCLDGRGGLRIGNNVSISPGVWLLTNEHDMNDPYFAEALGEVDIDDYVWIGSRALVLSLRRMSLPIALSAECLPGRSVPAHAIFAMSSISGRRSSKPRGPNGCLSLVEAPRRLGLPSEQAISLIGA